MMGSESIKEVKDHEVSRVNSQHEEKKGEYDPEYGKEMFSIDLARKRNLKQLIQEESRFLLIMMGTVSIAILISAIQRFDYLHDNADSATYQSWILRTGLIMYLFVFLASSFVLYVTEYFESKKGKWIRVYENGILRNYEGYSQYFLNFRLVTDIKRDGPEMSFETKMSREHRFMRNEFSFPVSNEHYDDIKRVITDYQNSNLSNTKGNRLVVLGGEIAMVPLLWLVSFFAWAIIDIGSSPLPYSNGISIIGFCGVFGLSWLIYKDIQNYCEITADHLEFVSSWDAEVQFMLKTGISRIRTYIAKGKKLWSHVIFLNSKDGKCIYLTSLQFSKKQLREIAKELKSKGWIEDIKLDDDLGYFD